MKYFSIFLTYTFFALNIISCRGQNTDDLIKAQQEKLSEQQNQVEDIIDEIENLKLQKIKETLEKYIPKTPFKNEIIYHSAFVLSYNEDHEQADWVMHVVPKDVITGTVTRTNDFRVDPAVSTGSADVADYWYSGYDRGHLAPSADFRWSKKALSESYYYSNMSPQVPDLNRISWNNLEMQVREWVVDHGELLVISGPVLHDKLPKIQQGSFRVSIPEAYYKIIVDMNAEQPKAIAFLMPNASFSDKISNYVVTIDSIEALTNIDFFPNLANAEAFESTSNFKDWKYTSTVVSEAPNFKYDLNHIPTKQANYFIGTDCNVCGKVVATRYNKNSSAAITYINFDEQFPNSPFTAIVFGKDRINFTYEPEVYLKDKLICVRGKVELHKGKPQIIVNSEKQFSVYQP
ncbi:MAG TPA: DNA/RNA non-specific endonuclease [Chitinophagales bacterium]|nr:DNA/RNA non-specific endonuclease [Chitinophagales bacterium]